MLLDDTRVFVGHDYPSERPVSSKEKWHRPHLQGSGKERATTGGLRESIFGSRD